MGMLGWTPDTFWHATPIEFANALDGKLEMMGVKKGKTSKGGPKLSRDECRELERIGARFPDKIQVDPVTGEAVEVA